MDENAIFNQTIIYSGAKHLLTAWMDS